MKNCQKCGSKNIKKNHFARKFEDGEEDPKKQGDQMVNYSCLDCGNTKSVKFSEDNSLEE